MILLALVLGVAAAAESPDPVAITKLLVQAGEVDGLLHRGHFAEAYARLATLRRLAEASKRTDLQQAIALVEVEFDMLAGDLGRAEASLDRMEQTAKLHPLVVRKIAVLRVRLEAFRGERGHALSRLDEVDAALRHTPSVSYDELAGLAILRMSLLADSGRLDEALDVRTQYGTPPGTVGSVRASLDLMTGMVSVLRGDHAHGAATLERVEAQAARRGWSLLALQAELFLAEAAATRNDVTGAEAWWKEAGALAEGMDAPGALSHAAYGAVQAVWAQGRPEEALAALQAWRARQKPAFRALFGPVQASLEVALQVEAGRPREALAVAEAYWKAPGEDSPELRLGIATDALEAALSEPHARERWEGETSRLRRSAPAVHPVQVRAAGALARAARAKGAAAAEEALLLDGLAVADRVAEQSGGDALERARTRRSAVGMVDRLVELRAGRGDWLGVVAASELGRSRAALEQMAAGKGIDPETARLRGAEARIHQLDLAIADLRASQVAAVGDTLRAATREREALARSLARVEAPRPSPAISEAALRALPRPGECIVTWHLSPGRAWAVAWSEEGVSGGSLALDMTGVASLVDEVRGAMGVGGATRDVLPEAIGRPPVPPELLARAEATLFDPVRSCVSGATRLSLLPHGALHYLPFAALPGRSAPLGIELPLVQAPSAAILARERAAAPGSIDTTGALLVADPRRNLPGAEKEGLAVAKLLEGARLLLGPEASEAAVRAALPAAPVVLFSSHARFEAEDPLSSYLQLAPRGDQRLTVAEIQQLELTADLVVLSACQTARSAAPLDPRSLRVGAVQGSPGDDVVGLTTAFLVAGADRVAGTLWSVEDEATGLMVEAFFRQVDAGVAPPAAMQAARREVYAAFPHPASWAAFYYVGPE